MNVLRVILGMMCILVLSTRLGAENTQAKSTYNAEGLKIDENNGQLLEVDRSRSYGSLKLEGVTSLSTKEKDVKVFKDGKEEELQLALFGEVKVRKLCFTDSIKSVDTKSLRGIKGLEEIVFEDVIPEMKEEHHWYTFGEDDWRNTLKVVTLHKDVNLAKLAFAGEIKCIRLEETMRDCLKKTEEASKGLRSCGSLEKILIPFKLAKDPEIKWNEILKFTGLWDDTVVSDANEETGERVLVKFSHDNDDEAIEIPEGVTHIRGEAFGFAERVVLPISFKAFIGESPNLDQKTLILKENSVFFTPSIDDFKRNKFTQTADELKVLSELDPSVLFPRTQGAASLTMVSAYTNLTSQVEDLRHGDIYSLIHRDSLESCVNLPMNARYKLTLLLKVETMGVQNSSQWLPVELSQGNKTLEHINFTTPEEQPWIMKVSLWFGGFLGFMVAVVLLSKKLFPAKNVINVAIRRFLDAPWWKHLGFAMGILFLLLAVFGVCADWCNLYLWQPVEIYLNRSFLSSLVISIGTTGIKMLLGLLQGLSIKPFGIGIDFKEALAPIVEMLGRVELLSWISTVVLVFVRTVSEIIQRFGTVLWTALSGACLFLAYPALQTRKMIKNVWVERVFYMIAILTLGLPMFLFGASWFSTEMNMIAGSTFEEAMNSFSRFLENCSINAFLSIDALQGLLSQLTDACVEFTTASFTYLAVKIFDCFVVPLGLFGCVYTALKRWGIVKKQEPFSELLKSPHLLVQKPSTYLKAPETPKQLEQEPVAVSLDAPEETIVVEKSCAQEETEAEHEETKAENA